MAIPEDTAEQNTAVDEAESGNDEHRSVEGQIRAQRRALLEYEFKKVNAQLEELQRPKVPATNFLMANDINSNTNHRSKFSKFPT